MGGRAAMLTTRQKLHLIAIEEEIAHLQLQMCMEECAYLGAKSPDEKEANATAYIESVITPVLEALQYKFETKTYEELQNIINKKLPGTTDTPSDTTHSSSFMHFAKATVSSTAKAAGNLVKTISKLGEKTTKAKAYKSIETVEAKGNCVMVLIGFTTTENETLVMHITTKDILRHTKENAIEWTPVWEKPPDAFESYVQDFTTIFGTYTEKLPEKKIVSTEEMAKKAQIAQINRDLQQHEQELKAQEALQKAQIAAANKKAAAEQAAANRTAAAEAAAQQAEANRAAAAETAAKKAEAAAQQAEANRAAAAQKAAQQAEANRAAAAKKAEAAAQQAEANKAAAAQKAAQQAEANRAAAAKKAEEAAKKAAAHPAPTHAPATAGTTHAPATQHAPAAATTHAPATQHAPAAAATTRVPARRP
jgi:hypothetical protein